jgi:hypothetical protein
MLLNEKLLFLFSVNVDTIILSEDRVTYLMIIKTIYNEMIYRNLIINQYFLLDLVVSYLKADLTTEIKPSCDTY